jgi:hypothetical protein
MALPPRPQQQQQPQHTGGRARLHARLTHLAHEFAADVASPQELYWHVVEVATLLRETCAVQERYRKDVFDLFARAESELLGEGRALTEAVSVVAFHKAELASRAYAVAATLHFAFPTDADAGVATPGKKKTKQHQRTLPSPEDCLVQLQYRYEESTVGPGGRHRGRRVPVLQSPCKEVTLHIAASRGRAGLNQRVLVEFKMFTAGVSPAEVKYAIPEDMLAGEGDDGDNGEDGEDSDQGDSDVGGSDTGDGDGDGDDDYDTADYYTVHVDRDALTTAARWLQTASGVDDSALAPATSPRKAKKARRRDHGDSTGGGDNDDGDDEGEEAEAKAQNMLMFVLSAPYVDEAWGVHDLILDSCFPRGDDDDEDADNEEGHDA